MASEPEKAQIAIEGADPLYREIRIENTLKDVAGEKVRLKQYDQVDVTVETDSSLTEFQEQKQDKKHGEAKEEDPKKRKAS